MYSNGDIKPPVGFSGMDAAKVFYEKLREDALYISKEYHENIIPIKPLTESEKL